MMAKALEAIQAVTTKPLQAVVTEALQAMAKVIMAVAEVRMAIA